MVKNDNFLVKYGLFICELRIRGPKWRNVSTANNEGNLYLDIELVDQNKWIMYISIISRTNKGKL